MTENRYADDFADCVVRRNEYDTVMNPGVVIATIVVPALVALVIITIVLNTNAGTVITEEGVRAGIVTAMVTECYVVSFLLYMLASRTVTHQKRDSVWAASLIGYLGSKGCDTSRLKSLASKMHRCGKLPLKMVSSVICGLITMYLLFLIVYFDIIENGVSGRIYMLAAVSYIVLIIQFLLTTGATYGFPHSHEKSQIEFTEELSRVMEGIGMDVEPMRPLVGRPHWIICAVLFVVTLGLFSFILFVFSCRNTNLHIRNQHAYEDDVLDTIIKKEGGRGVRPIEGSEPGTVVHVLKSLF